MNLNQHHQTETRILVAETIFKGVFTKSKVISHLSDKIAPNELKSVLNDLLKDKFVKVSKIKDILEIEESKLNVLRGVQKPKKIGKTKNSKGRRVRYTLNRLSKHYSLNYIFYVNHQKVRGQIKLSLDTNFEVLNINSLMELHIKESNTDFKDFEFDFYRFISKYPTKEKKAPQVYQTSNVRKVGWFLKKYEKNNTYSLKYRFVYKQQKKLGTHHLGHLSDEELDVQEILTPVIKEKYPETKDLEFTFTLREFK